MIRDEKAMTLTEVLISALLFALVVGGLFAAVLAANKSWQIYGAKIRAQQEARKAISLMARDFRAAQNPMITPGTGSLTVTFSSPGVGSISYSWQTSGLKANQIIRQTPTSSQLVAQHISALSVVETGNVITVDVTAAVAASQQQNSSFRLVQQVDRRL